MADFNISDILALHNGAKTVLSSHIKCILKKTSFYNYPFFAIRKQYIFLNLDFIFHCDFMMFLTSLWPSLLNSMKAAESLSDLPNWMPVFTEMTLLILMP